MSAWDVWLHPRYHSRQIELLRQQVEALEGCRDEAERLKKALDSQLEANAAAEKAAADSARSVEVLTQELLKTRKELDEERAFTKQVEEIEERFEEVIEMKERYEERIATLKRSLADARNALRLLGAPRPTQKELTPINMSERVPDPAAILRSEPAAAQPQRKSAPKPPQSTPSLFREDSGKNPETKSTEKKTDEDSTSDEWLMHLPHD